MNPKKIHEETLQAITELADLVENNMWEDVTDWNRDGFSKQVACIECGRQFTARDAPEELRSHKTDCKLLSRIEMLRAFVRIEEKADD